MKKKAKLEPRAVGVRAFFDDWQFPHMSEIRTDHIRITIDGEDYFGFTYDTIEDFQKKVAVDTVKQLFHPNEQLRLELRGGFWKCDDTPGGLRWGLSSGPNGIHDPILADFDVADLVFTSACEFLDMATEDKDTKLLDRIVDELEAHLSIIDESRKEIADKLMEVKRIRGKLR